MKGTMYPHAAGFVAGDRPQIVTSRFQYDDSHTLDRFLATDGYKGLQAALAKSPVEVHDDVKSATVLGRGGAGFPAGVKWGLTPQGVWPRYLVVNGDESEPGTYKDRLLMELDPHQLIEGCLIACYAAGLSQCFLYIRGEMALAQERVAVALNEAYAAGYIGKNILGSNFSVDIVLHWGAGAYVVGEETALIESLEGNRGMPRLKPPFFPAAIGLYGKPTIVNNVETLANLPWLLRHGVEAYTAIGTPTSPGTRMVAIGPREATGRVRDHQRHRDVPRAPLRRSLWQDSQRQRAEGVRARRRFCAVVIRQLDLPFKRSWSVLPVRCRFRRRRSDGRATDIPCGVRPGALLCPRVVRQVVPCREGGLGWNGS